MSQRGLSAGRTLAGVVRSALLGAASLGLASLVTGCRVPPPTVAEWVRDAGFRTPEQAFETFRMAFRAELSDWQYRCFSSGFKRDNKLGILSYLEFRDELLRQEPLLGYGLHKAQVAGVSYQGADRARLEAHVAGRTLVFEFVREDYWEIFGGRELLLDSVVDGLFESGTLRIQEHDGQRYLVGGAPLPGRATPDTITEVRFGMEWKIDDFRSIDRSEP